MKKLILAGSVVLVLLTCATQTHAQPSRSRQSTFSSASIPFVTEITPRSAPSGAVIQLQIQSDLPSGSLVKYRLAIGGVTARFYPVHKDDWNTIVAVVPYNLRLPADVKPGSLIPVDVIFFDPQENGGNVYSQFSLLIPTGLKGKEVEISGVRKLSGSDFDVTFNDYIPVELWPQVTIYFDNKAVGKILKMDERAFTVERPSGVPDNRFEVFARVGDKETSVFKYDFYATPVPTATATTPSTVTTLASGKWGNAELIFLIVGGALVAIAIWFLLRRTIFSSRRSESLVPTGIEPLSLPDVPSDLIDACATGECVLYGGPGLSIESGFPTRSEFVKGLVDWAHNAKLISQDEAASYRVEVDRGQGDAVADSLASRLTTSDQQFALTSYLQSIFLKRARPSELHAQLKGIGFSAILTTNLDTLLETTFAAKDDQVYTPSDSESLLSAMTRRTFFILKLHGKLSEPGAVVVAPGQYESSTSGNTLFSDFMKTLFLSRTLLFVGSSVEGIEDYLRSLTQGREIAPERTHYALVAVTDRAWRAKAELLQRRFGVKVLPYTGDHAQLSQFLNKLKDALPAKEGLSPASPETVSRLKRITLANIGPFENLTLELDLDFKPAWHIFLGDNGVGKSTVIKAIALALCGKEAQPYASRFLRDNSIKNTTSEELTGTITLETNNKKTYVTTIRRNKKGDVELISSTSKPLEAEGWLALGFPPLRTTSWEGPKGPDADIKRKSRPVVSDLLPLVAGDVDPRLDKLKQWVVNLDYLRSKSKGSERNHAAPIQKVFDIIGSVAEGMKLTYKGVGDGNRILVETEDGKPIPLESLSQGTISLIGWIGIFLQRLYEVFDEDEDPTKRYALILMDEIDAHMHPRWQRTLVTHLKELFPNAQFIATTHSPLVVSGLPARQVVRFAKDAAGKTTIIPIAPDMTTGYTDQILTSLLFDLPTTLDDTTEKMMEDYLVKKDDPTADENEREDLRQELMTRVPPRTATYEEKHEQMVSRAKLLQEAGEKLNQLSPDAGRTILARANRLMTNLNPGAHNDSD